ncbi:MAG: FlgD immunoglobulin-like domain containing protein [Bacillota bacterium]
MKRIVLLFLICAPSVFAQQYYMNIWSNGKVTSIPVQDIKKLTFSGIISSAENSKAESIIKNFALFQNFPNPFNPSTRIDYQIPVQGNVEVRIFNINGSLIRTFTNLDQPAGSGSITWDGRNNDNQPVASGMYIYRVTFGNSILSKKMLLLK